MSVSIYASKKVCSDTGDSPKMSASIHKHFDFPVFLRGIQVFHLSGERQLGSWMLGIVGFQ